MNASEAAEAAAQHAKKGETHLTHAVARGGPDHKLLYNAEPHALMAQAHFGAASYYLELSRLGMGAP